MSKFDLTEVPMETATELSPERVQAALARARMLRSQAFTDALKSLSGSASSSAEQMEAIEATAPKAAQS